MFVDGVGDSEYLLNNLKGFKDFAVFCQSWRFFKGWNMRKKVTSPRSSPALTAYRLQLKTGCGSSVKFGKEDGTEGAIAIILKKGSTL